MSQIKESLIPGAPRATVGSSVRTDLSASLSDVIGRDS